MSSNARKYVRSPIIPKMTCTCGLIINKSSYSVHQRSDYHKNVMRKMR